MFWTSFHYVLKNTSVLSPPWYQKRIIVNISPEFRQFDEFSKDFLFANRYGPIAHIKKVWNSWRPYWRRYWTCKWKMSFSRRHKFENNMQACFNILVLHRKLWCCISEEANLCCSMLLIPKTRRILTEIEDFISKSIWPFFDKKSKMILRTYFWTRLHKRLKLVYLTVILTTLFRFKRNSTFLLGIRRKRWKSWR